MIETLETLVTLGTFLPFLIGYTGRMYEPKHRSEGPKDPDWLKIFKDAIKETLICEKLKSMLEGKKDPQVKEYADKTYIQFLKAEIRKLDARKQLKKTMSDDDIDKEENDVRESFVLPHSRYIELIKVLLVSIQ